MSAELSGSDNRPIRKGAYPELTFAAIGVGLLLGVLIAISIGYASLILGFSIEGSELAAILGFGILRGILKRSSIIENNINQTVASAVNGASSGMMFSVPALFILKYNDFNPYLMVFGCIAGVFLGISFIIPLRKQMIDYNRLAFPGGIAVAAILKSPGAGMRKAYLLLGAAAVSGIAHVFAQVLHAETWALGEILSLPTYMNVTYYLSLLTIGTGFLAGKGGFAFVIGGYVCYWVLAPILSSMGYIPSPEEIKAMGTSVPGYLRLSLFRPTGIGIIIGGAIAGILVSFPLIVGAIRSMQKAARTKTSLSKEELPIKFLYFGIASAFIVLIFIAIQSVQEMGILRGVVMALFGTLWIWMAGVILSECIGRTNWSPLSGMTLIGVTILIFIASGLGDRATVIASVMVGAAMCVAMSQATDLMLDLKSGYLIGASPRKQQIAQMLGGWLGPIVIICLIYVLHDAYVLGSDRLPAPQGQALASMVQGILGGDVPIEKYIGGAGLGILLGSIGLGGLGINVGLGFYLPFAIVLTYTIGTFARIASDRYKGRRFSEGVGIPIAAGLIVGEALVGVGAALIYVFKGMSG